MISPDFSLESTEFFPGKHFGAQDEGFSQSSLHLYSFSDPCINCLQLSSSAAAAFSAAASILTLRRLDRVRGSGSGNGTRQHSVHLRLWQMLLCIAAASAGLHTRVTLPSANQPRPPLYSWLRSCAATCATTRSAVEAQRRRNSCLQMRVPPRTRRRRRSGEHPSRAAPPRQPVRRRLRLATGRPGSVLGTAADLPQ